jgi:hypothetical protein
LFAAFEASLEELHTIVFRFAELKKYDVTRHALNKIKELISQYLIARNRSLRVPGSSMALFYPSENRFDGVLSRQLERLKAHADRGIGYSDQELVKEVVTVLADICKISLNIQSFFAERGENPVTGFISAYLWGAIQNAATRRLDDVALEGADHVRDLCKESINRQFYLDARMLTDRLEQLATISIASRNDVVLQGAVRALSDCLLHNSIVGYPGSHITQHLLEHLVRIVKWRLDSPLGLDMNKVSYSIGPFISPTESSSLAQISANLANGISQLSSTQEWNRVGQLRSSYKSLHDDLWRHLADMGLESVKKNSFLMHFINSSAEEIIRIHFWLLQTTDLSKIEPIDMKSAQEQYSRDSFREKIQEFVSWQITGVYSRIIPAMFEYNQLNYLDETIELQCTLAFWCINFEMTGVAIDVSKRIMKACQRLTDPYRSARTSTHVAHIGIYALATGANEVFDSAKRQYQELRTTFRENYPDLRFVGDFESVERELIEERPQFAFSSHDQTFYSVVTPAHIRAFFKLIN